MSNVINFPKAPSALAGSYYSEVVSDAVNIYRLNDDGKYEQIIFPVPLIDIPERANAGEWDNDRSIGLRIWSEWIGSSTNHSSHDILLFWRWLIADSYVAYLKEKNGAEIYFDVRHSLNTSRAVERITLVNNVEGALTGHYGLEEGINAAIQVYQNFILMEDGKIEGLTPRALTLLNELHAEFVTSFISGGLPNETKH